MFRLVASAALPVLAWYFATQRRTSQKQITKDGGIIQRREPPRVPYLLPYIGHALSIASDPDGFIRACHEKYGDAFTVKMFGMNITYVRGEKYIHTVAAGAEPKLDIIVAYQQLLEWLLGNDFFHNLNKSFYANLSQVRVDAHTTTMARLGLAKMESLLEGKDGSVVDMRDLLNHVVLLQSILASMGEEFAMEHFEYIRHRMEIIESDYSVAALLAPYLSRDKNKRQQARLELVDLFKNEAIRRVKAIQSGEHVSQDFMTALLMADYFGQDVEYEHPEGDTEWAEEEKKSPERVIHLIGYTVFGAIFGAHTNTYVSTVYMFRELVKHPKYVQAIRDEVMDIFGPNPLDAMSNPDMDSTRVLKLKTLHRCITETARIYGMGGIFRGVNVPQGLVLDDRYFVPYGHIVSVDSTGINRSDDLYGPTKATWDPERFADDRSANFKMDTNLQTPYATSKTTQIMAFGCGRKICPGRFLAYRIIALSVVQFCVLWDMELVQDLDGVVNTPFPGMRLMKGQLKLKVTRRA